MAFDPPLAADGNPSLARPAPRHLARHAAQVLTVSLLVGLVLDLLGGEGRPRSIVYSSAIGLCSWACIDLGRFALRPDPRTGWPPGWRGLALIVVGCIVGFLAGNALGNLALGREITAFASRSPRGVATDLVITALVGGVISTAYYVKGREAVRAAALARSERDATLARLALLQSQLEPHMLFNTLANLRVLITLDPPRAQAMLDRLIAFLRATLDGSRTASHPLAAEFDRLADYLALMAVRMGPRLQVALDLPDELRGCAVPPLLLQPLVENSIGHGLEPKLEGGRIAVRAERQGQELWLSVRDTGVGLDRAAPSSGAGFGVGQVRERLATLFGERARLSLEPAGDAEGGTLARVVLPLREAQA